MTVFNSGSTKSRQNFYGDNINDAPTSAYKGDIFEELTGDKLIYKFNGSIWELDESSIVVWHPLRSRKLF